MPYNQAVLPLATHAFHYGTGCFEGIRGYYNKEQKKIHIFRLQDHYARLARSCRTLSMELPMAINDLCATTTELLKKNHYQQDVYIRPIIYKSDETVIKFDLTKLSDSFAIYTTPLGHFLDVSSGIKAITSSWQRVDRHMIPPSAKPTGLYLNTCLAKTEVARQGADEAILLNNDGSISEGSAENIFIIKDNHLITPATTENILEGITRNTIIEIAKKELKLRTIQRKVMARELIDADGIFLTGTGAEITPIVNIDGHKVTLGTVTTKLQKLYFDIVNGTNLKYSHWLTSIS